MLLWVAAAVTGASTTAAAGPVSGGSSPVLPVDITSVLQFGLLGLIFLCIVFRKFLVPEWALTAAEKQAVRETQELAERLAETREQLNRLQNVFQDQMIPALTRATEINARYMDELQKARYRRGANDDEGRT